MRTRLYDVKNMPLEGICPPAAHSERWPLLRYALDPEAARDPQAVAEPAIYVRGLSETSLRDSLGHQIGLLDRSGIAGTRLYCDIVSGETPLLERPGLLRLMKDSRKGFAALTTASGLFTLRPGVNSSAGCGSSIDWTHRWSSGSPPSPAASYTVLFAGYQRGLIPPLPVIGGSRVRNGRLEIGFPYAPAVDQTYGMVVEGRPLDEISGSVEELVRPWNTDDPLVASLLTRLRRLASDERAQARKEAA